MEDNLKKYISELIQEIEKEIDESTTSGNVSGYSTPNAFSDNGSKDKNKKKKIATQLGMKLVGKVNETVNEKISKEEWVVYPLYARKLKPYLQKLFNVPLKVKVIKQANHNPWIEVRVARFGKDIIPNDFRVKVAKSIGASGVRDWDNVNYGNIRVSSIDLKHDQWVKLLGNKIKESVVNESSTISKQRAQAELKQKLKGKRSDGMGKYTATIYGMDGSKRIELKSLNDLKHFTKFEIGEDDPTEKVNFVVLYKNKNDKNTITRSNNFNTKSDGSKFLKSVKKKGGDGFVVKKADAVKLRLTTQKEWDTAKKTVGLKESESVNERINPKFYNARVQYIDPKNKKKFIGDVVRYDNGEYKVNLGKDGRFEKYILAKEKDLKIVSKSKKKTFESVNEAKIKRPINRWLAIKNDESKHPHKKMAMGLKELKYQLAETQKFFTWYNQIKSMNELDSSDYWKRTNKHIYKIKERLINIARTIQEIEK